MTADKKFCMNSYLMFRYVYDEEKCFSERRPCRPVKLDFERMPVVDSGSLQNAIKSVIDRVCAQGKAALALSGGVDSAVLARMVPAGTKAYTFRCIVQGVSTIDESAAAGKWAELNRLYHEVIDIYWDDMVKAADACMENKGAPIHSIEAQIYLAAKRALKDGKTYFIFGENADIIYGGMDGLLARDWFFSEFADRYTYIMPYRVLKEPMMLLEPYRTYEIDGHIDGYDFINTYFRQEALGTYINACETAGIEFIGPYSRTYLNVPIDYGRIRAGDTKYIIRELFRELYPGTELPSKIPMPRPMNEWLAAWRGPLRPEFIPRCTEGMTGDQKWMIWCLERYLNKFLEDEKTD